jgi:hypothetical protein
MSAKLVPTFADDDDDDNDDDNNNNLSKSEAICSLLGTIVVLV